MLNTTAVCFSVHYRSIKFQVLSQWQSADLTIGLDCKCWEKYWVIVFSPLNTEIAFFFSFINHTARFQKFVVGHGRSVFVYLLLIMRLTPGEGWRCESVCLTFRTVLITKQTWSRTHPHYGGCGAALMTNSYGADCGSSLGAKPLWTPGKLNDFIIADWGDKTSVSWNSLFSLRLLFSQAEFQILSQI